MAHTQLMTTTYIIYAKHSDGETHLQYNDQGLLISFEMIGNFTDKQIQWLHSHLPCEKSVVAQWQKTYKLNVKEVVQQISFERFWNLYSNKIGKKRAEIAWNRLTKGNQLKAIESIPKYRAWLNKKGIMMKHPETYLKAESFNDDFTI